MFKSFFFFKNPTEFTAKIVIIVQFSRKYLKSIGQKIS